MPINYKHYPPNWKTIRQRILARADNRCERCGLENGILGYRDHGAFIQVSQEYANARFVDDEPKIMKIVLTVAHFPDPDTMHCTDDNLLALCQQCHLRLDAQMHTRHAAQTRHARKYAGQLELPAES